MLSGSLVVGGKPVLAFGGAGGGEVGCKVGETSPKGCDTASHVPTNQPTGRRACSAPPSLLHFKRPMQLPPRQTPHRDHRRRRPRYRRAVHLDPGKDQWPQLRPRSHGNAARLLLRAASPADPDAGPGEFVQFLDGNGLNCRRSNIRIATQGEISRAAKPSTKPQTSRFKGVCFDRTKNQWRAAIRHNGERIFLGHFDTEEKAVDGERCRCSGAGRGRGCI